MKLNKTGADILSAPSDEKQKKGILAKLCIGAAVILAVCAFVITLTIGNVTTQEGIDPVDEKSTAKIDMYYAQAQTQTTAKQTEKTTVKQTTQKTSTTSKTTKKTTAKTTSKSTAKTTESKAQKTQINASAIQATTQASIASKAAVKPKTTTVTTTTAVKFSAYKMYTNDTLNLRSGAGTSFKKIAEIPFASEITVTGKEANGWYPVKYGDKTGYVFGTYIQKDKPKVAKVTTAKTTQKAAADTTSATEPLKTEFLGSFKITAYCACEKCCGAGATGKTASGTVATQGRTIAASSKFPFGTKLMINGTVYTVEDRGGSVNGNVIDMFFATHQDACNWGVRYLDVYKVL